MTCTKASGAVMDVLKKQALQVGDGIIHGTKRFKIGD